MAFLAIATSQIMVIPIFWGEKNPNTPKSAMMEEHEKINGIKCATKLRYAISIQVMTEQGNVSYQDLMRKGLHD